DRYHGAVAAGNKYKADLEDKDAKVSQAQQREQQAAYFRRILLADRALQAQPAPQVLFAQQVLNECQQDLRHWEWKYLNRMAEQRDLARGNALLEDRDPKHPINVNRPAVGLTFAPDGGRLAVAFSGAPGT